MSLLIRKDQPPGEVNEYPEPMAPVQPAKAEVTHSIIEIAKPCDDQSPPPQAQQRESEVKEY